MVREASIGQEGTVFTVMRAPTNLEGAANPALVYDEQGADRSGGRRTDCAMCLVVLGGFP